MVKSCKFSELVLDFPFPFHLPLGFARLGLWTWTRRCQLRFLQTWRNRPHVRGVI